MARVAVLYNSKCMKCEIVSEKMVRVGPMVFCRDCFKVEFLDYQSLKGEVDSKSDTYKKWIELYKKL